MNMGMNSSRMALLAGILALGLAAPATADAGDCAATASVAWTQAGADYSIEAFSHGKVCANAVVVIVAYAPDDTILMVEAFPASQMMLSAGAPTSDDMGKALADWINQDSATLRMSADLPEWTAELDMPMLGDFAFMPAEGFDRDYYNALRAENRPLLCFVQGMESMACHALAPEGFMFPVGIQTFPG